jgi:hypothetical protein
VFTLGMLLAYMIGNAVCWKGMNEYTVQESLCAYIFGCSNMREPGSFTPYAATHRSWYHQLLFHMTTVYC